MLAIPAQLLLAPLYLFKIANPECRCLAQISHGGNRRALQETAPDVKFVSMEPTARVRLAKDVLMQKVGDDAILLNLNTENYFSLDDVGTRIINALQESDSVKQAIGKLVGIYEVDESKLTSDTIQLVEECQQHGLLQITEA